jgi:acetyl esterase/lipase
MFIAQARNDSVVNSANARLLSDRCRAAAVPAELHMFEAGDHGFGLGRPGTDSTRWPDLYRTWLTALDEP